MGVPPGLGSYATKEERLDARLAAALMGIQAVKGVEIGEGFELAGLRGSEAHDEIVRDERGLHRETNRAGGIEGGVSNGEEIVVRAAMKPLPTLMRPLRSVDLDTGEAADALVERSDVSAVEALAVVAEEALARPEPTVIAVGGGAVETPGLLHDDRATVVHLPVDVEAAWQRAQSSDRPLAQDEAEFRRRFELRAPLYVAVADATARDADDVVLAAAGVHVERGALQRLG